VTSLRFETPAPFETRRSSGGWDGVGRLLGDEARGVVVYPGDHGTMTQDGIEVLPVHSFLSILAQGDRLFHP
jgi:hypothetical protein